MEFAGTFHRYFVVAILVEVFIFLRSNTLYVMAHGILFIHSRSIDGVYFTIGSQSS